MNRCSSGRIINSTSSWTDTVLSFTPEQPLRDGWYVLRTTSTETVRWTVADGWSNAAMNGCHAHVGSLPLLVASIEPLAGPFPNRLTLRGTEPLSSAISLVGQGLVDVTSGGATVPCSYSPQLSNAHDDLVTTGELRYECEAIDYALPLTVVVHAGIVSSMSGVPLTDLGGGAEPTVTWVPSIDGRVSSRTLDAATAPGVAR